MRYLNLVFVLAVAPAAGLAANAAMGCGGTDFQANPDGGGLGSGDGGQGEGGDAAPEVPVTCSPETADPGAGVFVDGAVGSDASCGSVDVPCKTISEGIDAANKTAGKKFVYVASGVYPEQIKLGGVTLTNGALTIEGAWHNAGGSFTRQCDGNPVTLVQVSPTIENVTVDARGLVGAVTLQVLTVNSKPVAGDGETLYGVFAGGDGAHITLDGVLMKIAAGGAGKSADPPAQPGPAGAGCDTPGTGAAGAPANAAPPAAAATYTTDGYVAGDGVSGGDGNVGANGAAGVADACVTENVCDAPIYPDCSPTNETRCGVGGKAGCGGAAGRGGPGGSGGGSSVGIYSWQAHVVVGNAHVTVNAGGAGAAGAAGGRGGIAGKGGSPFVDQWTTQCAPIGGVCVNSVQHMAGASGGTPGGAGSDGARGSGGAGGDSYCFVKGSNGGIATSGGQCTFGAGGAAGDGAPAGAPGKSGESN